MHRFVLLLFHPVGSLLVRNEEKTRLRSLELSTANASMIYGGRYRVVDNYVINLDRSEDRLNLFADNWRDLNLPFQRFAAYDGDLISLEDVNHSVIEPSWDAGSHFGRPSMSASEVGVSLSHVALWKTIYASELEPFDLSCIFEDDAVPNSNYKEMLSLALSDIPDQQHMPIDLLYLFHTNHDTANTINISANLIKPTAVNAAVAYCLTKRGAQKLISLLPVNDAVDDWMGHHVNKARINAMALRNQSVVFLDAVPTTIEHWGDYTSDTLQYMRSAGVGRYKWNYTPWWSKLWPGFGEISEY